MAGILFHVPDSGFDWDSFTGDDFTGDNGDPLNPVVWTDLLDEDSFSIQSNRANISIPSSGRNGTSRSTFQLSGDFDIQIDFLNYAISSATGYLRLFVMNVANTYGGFVGARDTGLFTWTFKVNGSYGTLFDTSRSNTFGKMKAVRTGSQLYFSRQDGGGGWSALGNATIDTSDMQLFLYAATASASTLSADFDNFVINSGTVVAP